MIKVRCGRNDTGLQRIKKRSRVADRGTWKRGQMENEEDEDAIGLRGSGVE